jgi:hypothetical protein
MDLSVELKKSDLSAFKRFFFLKHMKRRIYFVVIVALALPFMMNRDRPFDLLVYVSTAVVAGAVFGIIYLGSMYFTVTSLMKFPGGKEQLDKRKFSLREEGIMETSNETRKLHTWKNLKSIEQDANALYIFTGPGIAHILPKRYFRDQAQQREFMSLVELKIKDKS